MLIRVEGGTDAGTVTRKEREPWACGCIQVVKHERGRDLVAVFHPGHVYSCEKCGARRPT